MPSKYERLEPGKIDPISIHDRKSKVDVGMLGKIGKFDRGWAEALLDTIPPILAGEDIRGVVKAIAEARRDGKPIIVTMGAHVIKVGLSPLVIEMMRRGYITHLGMNGAGIIHDAELALFGHTSEDVSAGITTGKFAVTKETSEFLNPAINEGVADGMGVGESVGKAIVELNPPHGDISIVGQAYATDVPLSVHIAIGTDFIHMHPGADGAAYGEGSLRDFYLLAKSVSGLVEGGVVWNIGSAVVLPVVIEKAIALCQNLGCGLSGFTGINYDFIQLYRPNLNPVRRAREVGGKGIAITGHHEILLPLTAALLFGMEDSDA